MEYELYHHGILGMKWGIRRYQNPDGSLTPAGRKRLLDQVSDVSRKQRKVERARFGRKQKAIKQRDKAIDRLEKFANKLASKTISDKEVYEAVKSLNTEISVSKVATSSNINTGKSALERIAGIASTLGTIGIGVKNVAGGISAVRDLQKPKNSNNNANNASSNTKKKK